MILLRNYGDYLWWRGWIFAGQNEEIPGEVKSGKVTQHEIETSDEEKMIAKLKDKFINDNVQEIELNILKVRRNLYMRNFSSVSQY